MEAFSPRLFPSELEIYPLLVHAHLGIPPSTTHPFESREMRESGKDEEVGSEYALSGCLPIGLLCGTWTWRGICLPLFSTLEVRKP